MAWLAWLILLVSPVYGSPAGMMGDAQHGGLIAAVTQTMDHGHQSASTEAEHCCSEIAGGGHDANHACHCASVCGSALPAMALAELTPVVPGGLPVSPRRGPAPSVTHAPPLRPPTV